MIFRFVRILNHCIYDRLGKKIRNKSAFLFYYSWFFFFFFLRGKWCNLLLVFSFINNLGPKNVFWKNEKIIGSNYGKMVGMASIHIDLHKTAISRHSKKAYAKVSLLLQTSQKMVENVSLSHVSSSFSPNWDNKKQGSRETSIQWSHPCRILE